MSLQGRARFFLFTAALLVPELALAVGPLNQVLKKPVRKAPAAPAPVQTTPPAHTAPPAAPVAQPSAPNTSSSAVANATAPGDGAPSGKVPLSRVFYADLLASAAYSQGGVPGFGTPPSLGVFGAGFTIGIKASSHVALGVASDFQWQNQYSLGLAENFRAWRWNYISPAFVLWFGPVILKLDGQFVGPMHFISSSATGAQYAFSSPLGGRFAMLARLPRNMCTGIYFQYLRFGSQTIGDLDLSLAHSINFWQIGALFGLVL